MPRKRLGRSLFFALALGTALCVTSGVVHAAKKKAADEAAFTEAELQLELMSYGDRYAAIVAQALEDIERLEPPPEVRRAVLGDTIYSAAAVYTIAADPEPQVALLDMMVLTTLGRRVYEDYWGPRFGAVVDPMAAALTKLENDIWTVASPILDAAQKTELRERIETFHVDNPELSSFSHLRLADFPSRRETSTLRKKKSGGMFASVRRVTDEVEQTRIMAERALYVATRLPLLTGGFADVWTSRLLANPGMKEIRNDAREISRSSERMASVAEELPERLAAERSDAIDQIAKEAHILRTKSIEQALEGITKEREAILRQITDEEEGMEPLLVELHGTLTEANTLVVSVDALAERFDAGDASEPGEPFVIEDYRKTIVDAGVVVQQLHDLVQSTNELLNSQGAERLTPTVTEAIDAAGRTADELVDRSFFRLALLIVLALVGYVIARLTYQWLAMRVQGGGA